MSGRRPGGLTNEDLVYGAILGLLTFCFVLYVLIRYTP